MSPLPPPPPYSPGVENVSGSLPLNHPSHDFRRVVIDMGRPSHDYSAHEQSGLAIPPVERRPAEWSASVDSPYISTPLSTPGLISQSVDSPFSTSATFYFEGRPSPIRTTSDSTIYRLIIPPNARADQLSFPQPENIWLSRDVTRLDWSTFTNYLLPPDQDAHGNEKKIVSNHTLDPVFNSEGSIRTPSARKPVAISTKPDDSKVAKEDGVTPSVGNMSEKETEAERSRRIHSVVAEWNLHFFELRGVKVEGEIIPYSSELIPQTWPNLAAELPSESSSHSQGEDTPGSSIPDVEHLPSGSGWNWRTRPGRAARANETSDTANGRSFASADISSPSVQSSRAPSELHASDLLSRSSSSNEDRPHTPSTSHLEQPSPISSLSSTSTTSESLVSSNTDDLDDGDLKELRSAFAKFLLSSRSQVETAVALQELNQELQAQRQQTVKSLKAEMKVRRKEVKAMARQHKEEQRRERKTLKSAEKSRKKDLKTLKDEKKELEKRQKQARKEVKMFKKNAKKAGKGKMIGATAYKGWLEAMESNQQDSVTASTLHFSND
ncbi:MAG: hypothetical protein M1816_007450 [Peltula sp. TS41687]|nr:MAG: hypothetical protein M1816_007450 [Peltula sp. TS41687]